MSKKILLLHQKSIFNNKWNNGPKILIANVLWNLGIIVYGITPKLLMGIYVMEGKIIVSIVSKYHPLSNINKS
jgi:hypothetical protein